MDTAATLSDLEQATTWAREHAEEHEEQLMQLLRIPSVSTQPEHAGDCRQAASFLAAALEAGGAEHVQVMETGGHPMVYGDWLRAGPDAPTVLIYGHYDVQPADPVEEWLTPPFEPTVKDGNVHARGASDDKGQLLVHVVALRAWVAASGALPVNVKFVFEGEEESGSEHLDDFVERNTELLAADICLISDSHMLSAAQPSLVASLRGMSYMEIEVVGPSHDLHSGTYGGAVRNPAETLTKIVASLKDEAGRITIPGFYDDVVELTVEDRAELARVPFSDADFREETGISETFGEEGYTTYELVGARPTLEVNGLVSGYIGEGAKTVLPSRALAKISMRLVANQRWVDISEKFERHVRSLAPTGVSVDVRALHGGEPSLVDTGAPAMHAASAALERVFGARPVFMREGGSIPVVGTFERVLGITTVLMGFGLPDDRLHSPNEKFSLDQFHKGIAASIAFLHELGAQSRA